MLLDAMDMILFLFVLALPDTTPLSAVELLLICYCV